MNVARRLTSRLALPTTRSIGRQTNKLNNLGLKTQKRTALWTGERHGGYTLLQGRPPILYGYFFTMSWGLRYLILACFGLQAEIVEHMYYGHPPADWHEMWPKYWKKRTKRMLWWDPDCDLLDIYCWKKIDPKTLGHDEH
mmetsp:Transcript_64286/g.57800  ORF Transcript_64286/g.57800 Transcript_64286/m.57800 type:complete len:140 (+) Transcript_64286:79-498(+)